MYIKHPKWLKREYFEGIIDCAIKFLNQFENNDISNLKINFIVTNEYQKEVEKYHSKSENSSANAIFIPPFYQNNTSDFSVIIVNWDKIKNAAFKDKKADGDQVSVTIVKEIGSFEMKTLKCVELIEMAKSCLQK